MSQVYCESSDAVLDAAKRRVIGMKRLGQEIRAQVEAGEQVEPAITRAIVNLCNSQEFDVYFTDPSGHTGAMRKNPQRPELQYENAAGQWRRVKIEYHEDSDSSGTQIMHIGAGRAEEILMGDYLKGIAEEADSLVNDSTWDVSDPSCHNYFLATVNLRRCR